MMGDYALVMLYESLAGDGMKSGSQASPDVARLPGARLVRVTESERNTPLRESLIKSLTGGEPMLARKNYGDFFEFYPVFKLFMGGNHKPEIGGVDLGIWRRVRLILWPVTIPDNERRPLNVVLTELWEERSGILNWLIEGALHYLNNGLLPPQEVVDATEAYREEQDPVGCYISQCVTQHEVVAGLVDIPSETARAVYYGFVAWCAANAVRAWKEKSFGVAMSQKGFIRDRTKAGRRYLWITLHDVPHMAHANEPPPDDDPADDEVPI